MAQTKTEYVTPQRPGRDVVKKIPCADVQCPERVDCCTTVRWRISDEDYHDPIFREWWLIHEGARLYHEDGAYFIQWPMRCMLVSEDGLRCTDYERRTENCRLYVCRKMTGAKSNGDN
ncbi:MAG: YkgJ family cysteine cluster protein [Candidatus Latescibacterota bacterium]